MSHPVFIDGEPVLSGGRGQDSWQAMIRKRAGSVIVQPKLTFVVSALRRRGQYFDLDNLVHPALMAFDGPIDSMSARLYVGDRPGLLIEDDNPDSPTRIIAIGSTISTGNQGRPGTKTATHPSRGAPSGGMVHLPGQGRQVRHNQTYTATERRTR